MTVGTTDATTSNPQEDWLTDFNGMSTNLVLFYAKRLGNSVLLVCCMFIVTLSSCFWKDLFYTHLYNINRLICLVGRVFANDPGDLGSIPGCIIPKTLKMVLDTSLLNTQQYKVRIKLSYINNYVVLSNYFFLIIVICLHTDIWF